MSYVTKRDGMKENVHFDKITERINRLINPKELQGLDLQWLDLEKESQYLDPVLVAQKVVASLYSGITTEMLDIESAEICVNLSTTHPLYGNLGGRILISNLHKKTLNNFSSKMTLLKDSLDPDWYIWVMTNSEELDKIVNYNIDYVYDYFGFKTLEKSYLLKLNGKIIERPQDMLLRTAITLQMGNMEMIKKTYDYMSRGYYTHASPTLYNAGTHRMQCSSCFIENTEVMTMSGIKKIQEVKINDMIVTHTGKVRKVLQIHKNLLNNRKIFNLKVHKTKPIFVTDNHRFWTISKNDKEPCWRKISELSVDNYVAIPSYNGTIKSEIINIEELIKQKIITIDDYTIENNIITPITYYVSTHLNGGQHIRVTRKGNSINNIITIDENLANIFGIFVGDGHIMTKENKIAGIGFTVHCDNKKEIEFIKNIMEKSFGIKTSFHYMKTQNVTQLLYHSQLIGQLFKYMFGIKFNGKHIYNNMINWDINHIYNFLAGLITTDGCISKEGNVTCQMSNYNLMNQLYHLFRLYGIDVSLNEVKNPPKMATVIPWMLSIPKIKYVLERIYKLYNDDRLNNCINKIDQKYRNQSMPIIVNNVKFLKINELSETDRKPEYVYTIGVEEDHSYNVEGLICENCFLLGTSDDLSSIAETWNSCAQISKWAGGIGLHVSNIRGKDSLINGTGGRSNGLVPFLKVFNEIARWIDQGGRRPGSIAVYLEPHHPDIFDFIELRKNFGSETERARDLFLALWVSDLFMKQVEANGDWYLLSADECPGLPDVYGDEYESLYWKYVNEGKYRKKVSARKLWVAIIESQIETGMPYINYKDSVNRKSNQKNIGTIKSSNLCSEIVQYSDDKEYAVCNLASIALKPFVDMHKFNNEEYTIYSKPNCKFCNFAKTYLDSHNVKYTEVPFTNKNLSELKQLLNRSSDSITFPQIFLNTSDTPKYIGGWSELYKYTGGKFNWDKLYSTAYLATINLNQVIDINYYPVPQTKFSNVRHRPIGLGIQGMADALVLMRVPFDSEDALMFNSHVMETIYIASITASNDMAKARYEDMKTLISYFTSEYSSDQAYPEYYDQKYTIDMSDMNTLYHKLRPNKWELSKSVDSTTLGAYSSFEGSPFSEGKFQFDLWNDMTDNKVVPVFNNKWKQLREDIIKYGTRNSLLTALMPTASTSQILGNNECFEFFTNNIYTRKTQAGSFVLVNKYLVNDMLRIGMWNKNMKDKIIAMNGSIQTMDDVPPEFRALYKTIWEIKQVWVLKAAAARQPFVDQTQSMNIFMGEPDYQRLGSSHFWAWKNGLKTGMYYLRTKPSADAIKFTIDPNLVKAANEVKECDTCSA